MTLVRLATTIASLLCACGTGAGDAASTTDPPDANPADASEEADVEASAPDPCPPVSGAQVLACRLRPFGLAPTNDFVFVANWRETPEQGSIVRVSKTGEGATTIVVDQPEPLRIFADGGAVIWTNPHGKSVMSSALDGGGLQSLADDEARPNDVVANETHVYFGNFFGGTVRRLPRGGGTVETYVQSGGDPSDLIIDAANLYWTEPNAGRIWRASLSDASDATVLADGLGTPVRMALAEGRLFWTEFTTGSIMAMNVDGSSQEMLAQSLPSPTGIAVHKSFLYWASQHAVHRVPIAGGDAETLLDGLAPVDSVEAVDDGVYVSLGGGAEGDPVGMVLKIEVP